MPGVWSGTVVFSNLIKLCCAGNILVQGLWLMIDVIWNGHGSEPEAQIYEDVCIDRSFLWGLPSRVVGNSAAGSRLAIASSDDIPCRCNSVQRISLFHRSGRNTHPGFCRSATGWIRRRRRPALALWDLRIVVVASLIVLQLREILRLRWVAVQWHKLARQKSFQETGRPIRRYEILSWERS